MTAQSDRQASVRAMTGTAWSYEGDFHALFDKVGIPAGAFDGRFIAWAGRFLGKTFDSYSAAAAGLAAACGADTYNSVGTLDPYPSASAALDFVAQFYKQGATIAGNPANLPGWSFTRASNGTATDSAGNVLSFASGAPRITDLGLLVEEARTNLALWSQDLTNAAWVNYWAGPTSRTANAALAPDGTLTATRLVFPVNPNTQPPGVVTATSDVTGNTVAMTAWFKGAVGGEVLGFNLDDNGHGGTITLTTSWQRIVITGTVGASGGRVEITNTSTTVSPTIYVWGVQKEVGAFATSYIPTTSAAATRATDVPSVSGLALTAPYGLVAKATISAMTVGFPALMGITAAIGSSGLNINATNENPGANMGGGTFNGGAPSTTLVVGQTMKSAFLAQSNTGSLWVNGSAPAVTAGTFTPSVGAATLLISPGSNPWNSYVQSVQLLPNPPANMQALTQ